MMPYPYDPDVREYVARLLYDAIPALYKLGDDVARKQVPPAPELERLVTVLAAPLAVARQSIEELYADLFVDSAADWVLPYLAQMVGLELAFPVADDNRRDLRGAVGWRRRKGTPATLEDLGDTLAGQLVVVHEGWKRVQMAQDLDVLRPERLVPAIHAPSIAERLDGPLGTLHRALDPRRIGARTGQFHPRHLTHWVHPTAMFPVERAHPARLDDPLADPDFRFAFHALAEDLPLRCRRTGRRDPLATDRTPPMTFAETPGDWFDADGRFNVRICGLTAAVARPEPSIRPLSRAAAEPELLAGATSLRLLRHDSRRFAGDVQIALVAAPLAGPLPAPADTGPAAIEVRSHLAITQGGAGPSVPGAGGPLAGDVVAMLRLTAPPVVGRPFSGAVIEISGGLPTAGLGSSRLDLAQEGFHRGGLVVEVPETDIDGERWFYIAADGSLFEAQSTGSGAADRPLVALPGGRGFAEADRRTTGPGPAWPPQPASSVIDPFVRLPAAPAAGPAVLHGGRALVEQGGALVDAPAGTACALVFALTWFAFGRVFEPMQRLVWDGADPAAATWTPLGSDGRHLDAANNPITTARFAELATIVAEGRSDLQLAVRFESSRADAVLAASEIAWTAFDGRALLIYAPDLPAQAVNPDPSWPLDGGLFAGASVALGVAADGSTWRVGTTINLRRALGPVAPLREHVALLRRSVAGRSLCQWRNEVPLGPKHAATPPGRLDIDPAHGLFAIARDDPPQPYPADPGGFAPPSVTVDWQEGYTDHIGARPEHRSPALGRLLPAPTRIVSASGALRPGAPPAYHLLPRYGSLGDALADVAAAPQRDEVIEFQDSATYPSETLAWPAGVERLTIQAAERVRPVLLIDQWNAGAAAYEQIVLVGLALGFLAAGDFDVPPARSVALEFCSVLRADARLVFALTAGEGPERVLIRRCLTAGLALDGPGELNVRNSVIDAGINAGRPGLSAPAGRLDVERATVFGPCDCTVLEASETIFMDDIAVLDRFSGCIRYSRVADADGLPTRHRLAIGVDVDFVPGNRHDPAHARLSEHCEPAVLRGAEDGSEMGAFHDLRRAERTEAYWRRLGDFTPAGLVSGLVRLD